MPYGELARPVTPHSGINVDEAPHTSALHPVGFTVYDDLARRYRYVRFGGSTAQYDACRITVAADPYSSVVPTAAVNETLLGAYFNATSAVNLDYGWIIDHGKAEVKTSGVTAASSQGLGSSATAGTLTPMTSSANTTQAEAQRIMAAQVRPVKALTDTASGRSTVYFG